MAFDPRALDPSQFQGSKGGVPPKGALATDEWDNPSAEPIEDIDAQMQDLWSDSDRKAVYLSPDQQQKPQGTPEDAVTIEDFDGKGGTLITRDQEVADKALKQQTAGRTNQEIIGELTLAGKGKPSNPDALVVQKKTPEGAVMRESVQATPDEAAEVAVGWGEGVEIVGVPEAVQRRKDLINKYAEQHDLSSQLVADYMTQESGGKDNQVSSAGAEGLMQLMPGTAADMGVTDRMDDEQSVSGGAKYIALLKDRYEGNRELMAAAYNWGMGNVDEALKVHGANWKSALPEETANYLTDMAGRASGGLSEALATEYSGGFRVPTRESLDALGKKMQAKNIGYLEEGPFSSLEWEEEGSASTQGGAAGGRFSPTQLDPSRFQGAGNRERVAPKGEYGWGVGHAFKRGLLRAGQLIDLAQNDWDEYAEGEEALKKYAVSDEDAARLEELQESDGFWDAIGYYIVNPTLALQVVAESLPMSAPTLVGGAVGALGGPAGAMAGGGLGSATVEYLASISEAFAAAEVDTTDPEALKAAFADEELMADARERASKRALGVGMFDALSMGIAGRLYRPIAGLAKAADGTVIAGTKAAASKTRAVLGGTSEIVAQAAAGAGGEGAAQIFSEGKITDKVALASEAVGEVVPGLGEIAISQFARDRAAADKPDDTTPPPKKPKVKMNPDGSWSEVEPEGDVPADIDTSIPDTGDVDVDAEGADRQVETPPPESETATTSPTPTDETAPTKAQGETSSEVVEEVDVDAMLAAAQDKEDAADQAAKTAEEVTPLIDTKTLGPKVTKTIKDQKVQAPVRTAWRGLMNALSERYDTKATVPGGSFSGTGVAKFFKTLQDEIDITTDLPEIKAFLDEVTTGKPAEVIQALNRLTSQVRSSNPTLADAPIDSIAGQVQAVYNDFMAYYESHQRVSKAKKTKGQTVLKGNKIPMANKLGEMAAAIRELMKAAEDAGVLNWRAIEKGLITDPGLDANWAKAVDIAEEAAQAAQAPIEKKSGSGGKTKTIIHGEATLLKAANNLKEIAEKITPLLAEAEKSGYVVFTDTEAKVEETPAVTEEPAKPKKAPKIKRPSKRDVEAGELSQQAERQREIDEDRASDEAADNLPPKKSGKLTPKQRKQQREINAQNRAEVEALVAEKDAEKLANKIRFDNALVGRGATVAQLRKIAKTLGAKGYSKLTRTGVRALVAEQAQIVSDRQQRGVSAEEDAEIRAEVEKHVPEKFRSGHVFHAVRSVKDIASIVKSGLKKGTNIALDIMGQGVSMLGDVGTTVLVFESDISELQANKPYTVKEYQNDGVVTGTMKPVAIITDETDAAVISELKKTGLPVYQNGKRVVTVTTKTKKVTKKPDVKGADPADVFDKEQNITGPESAQMKADMDAETIGAAIEKAGVSHAAAKRIRGVMGTLDDAGKLALTKIAEEFNATGETVRFVAQFEALVGKVPSPALTEAYTEFFMALNEQESLKPETSEDAMDNLIDDHPDMTEDERAIAEMTGAIEPRIDSLSSEVVSTVVDEHNVPLIARLKKMFEPHDSLTPAEKARFQRDANILTRAVNKVRDKLLSHTSEVGSIREASKPAPPIKMQALADLMLSALPANHRFTHLFKLIKKTGVDMDVLLHSHAFGIDMYGATSGIHRPGSDVTGMFDPDKSTIELVFNPEENFEPAFVKTMLHEMIHAVTVARYYTDKKFAAHIDQLYMQAVERFRRENPDFPDIAALIEEGTYSPEQVTRMVKEYLSRSEEHAAKYYGLSNPLEFMAEAFTNVYFQEFLATTELQPSKDFLAGTQRDGGTFRLGKKQIKDFSDTFKNLFGMFIAATKRALGMSMRNSVLMEVMMVTAANFDTNVSLGFARGRIKTRGKSFKQEDLSKPKVKRNPDGSWSNVEDIPDKKVRSTVVNDTADAHRQRDKQVQQTRETLVEKLKGLPRAINLGFMNRDVIERNYRELFARAAKAAGHALSPLTIYIKLKQQASRIGEKYALRANAALVKLQKLDNKTRSKVFAMMRDTTLAQVWPHVALTHKLNAHLWTKPDKKGVSKLSPELGKAATKARKEWVALHRKDAKAAELLIEMAMLTKEIQNRKRLEALRTVGKVYQLDPALIKQLGDLESHEDIMNMFPGMYDKEGSLIDTNDTSERPADTVSVKGDSKEVKATKEKARKEWVKRRAIAQTAEEIVKGTSIMGPYFPLRRYGKYVVSSTEDYNENNEPYVSFHHTHKEAKRVAAGLEKKLKIPTYVTKKIESMAIPRDVESVTGELAKRMGSRKDGVSDYMGQRLQAAMIEIMADNTAYASQLKRHGVDGVASDDMGRAFEEYVFVTKYTLGDLHTAYEVHQALKDLKSLQSKGAQDVLRQGAATEEEVLLIGDVVNELAAQNREDAKDREMSSFQKGVGLIGFFNFLGAPSYWILNATQTLTVTLPYIGAKWGRAKGGAAYRSAAKTVLSAAKGAKSYEQFKANLPSAALKVVEELERQGILQSTIAHQFGDIMTPSTLTAIQNWAGPVGKATATALKLMETIPEGVEKYNRISTALAIYKLSDGNITEVADGVQATQFNYDSANRARLMKAAPEWAGTGLRAVITPMMMFKSYGIGLTRLLYGNMARAVVGKTHAERVEARKLAGGLIVSHSVFGGVAGGIMIAPVQAIVWAFNEAFREAGDEFDPEEAVQLYLQDVANDTVAALVARGLPAALGLEMSKSINLGNLIWMGNDRINLNDAGGVETMMTTALGPVAQWGVTSVREGARVMSGDPRGNWYDFAAAAIPLKMARGTIRGLKYEMEGVGTDTLTFIEPDDVSGWVRSAMGFRPTNIAMVTDFEYNEMGREGRRNTRKSWLIDRALRADTSRERAAVWDDIESFNRSLDRSDRISRGDVVRLRSRRRSRQRDYNRERR